AHRSAPGRMGRWARAAPPRRRTVAPTRAARWAGTERAATPARASLHRATERLGGEPGNFWTASLSHEGGGTHMTEMIREAGWPIIPILALGAACIAAAVREARDPRPGRAQLLVGASLALVLLGALG